MRDHALALACLRHGLSPVQARQVDDLPAEVLVRFGRTHTAGVEPAALRSALAACAEQLLRGGVEAELPSAPVVAERLADLRGGQRA